MKTCSQCGVSKSLDEFAKLHSAKDGHRSYCKACGRKYGNVYRQRHKAEMSVKHAVWRAANRAHYTRYQREYQRLYRMRSHDLAPIDS